MPRFRLRTEIDSGGGVAAALPPPRRRSYFSSCRRQTAPAAPRPAATAPGPRPAGHGPWPTAPSPRGAACHGGASFDRFLADLKQRAVSEGVSQRTLAEAAPYLVYDQGIVNRDRGQRVFGQIFTQFAGRMAAPYRMQQGQRASRPMRRRSRARKRNMACRRR